MALPFLYRFLTNLGAPVISFYLYLRKKKGREDRVRFRERLGKASRSRPNGKLVWLHAASVGEAMSVLVLIEHINARYPSWHILLTTGTVTSAKMMAARLPQGAIHQYVPVDRWPYVTKFLNHWRPDLALWIESELWPNMLSAMKERNIPAVLINGRMSERSYARWRIAREGIKHMLSAFLLGLAQTGAERNRFESLGLKDCRCVGNLKFVTEPLPFNEEELAALKTEIAGRPVWLMASTHAGEDEIALRIHKKLATTRPNLLTILIPRHPTSAPEILDLIHAQNISCAQRSAGQPLTRDTALYLADTMGEMGLFYRLSRLCCLAGSFTWGGHNPVEPAQLHCAVIFGPRMDNFAIMADDMLAASAAIQVTDENELFERLDALLDSPQQTADLASRAKTWVDSKQEILENTLQLLDPFFQTRIK